MKEGACDSQTAHCVSLCPSNTEILCAMGLGDCLVGVDLYSDYPPNVVHALPKLGPDLNIDIERLRALNPDLTVCSPFRARHGTRGRVGSKCRASLYRPISSRDFRHLERHAPGG